MNLRPSPLVLAALVGLSLSESRLYLAAERDDFPHLRVYAATTLALIADPAGAGRQENQLLLHLLGRGHLSG